MRIATPFSLILITLIHQDDDGIVVMGPYISVSCMDDTLTAEQYPEGQGKADVNLAHYCAETKKWWSTGGKPLIMWLVQTVDEISHRGHGTEQAKADYVRREFPPEDTSVFAK